MASLIRKRKVFGRTETYKGALQLWLSLPHAGPVSHRS